MPKYRDFLAGKRVALVGPADTLRGTGMGPRIDAYDIVVRLNHALPLPDALKGDVGARTDILYHNLNPKKQRLRRKAIARMRREGLKWIVSTHPASRARYRKRQRRVRKAAAGLVRFRVVPMSVKKRLRPRVGSANSGLIAIVDLLRYPIAELYVTGFSFYETPYLNYPKYKRRFIKSALSHHNQRKHKAYMAKLLKRESRLVVDPFIERILQKRRKR